MERSIVEYFSGHEGYRCGYCNSSDTCYSHGMWAHSLTPIDYQNLIDRGWRRSGKYCYKPTLSVTCCPLYTIRCDANKFTLTRSQKKVLKKVHKFLAYGDKGKTAHQTTSESSTTTDQEDMDVSEFPQEVDMQSLKRIKKIKTIKQSDVQIDNCEPRPDNSAEDSQNERCDRPSSSSCSPSKSSHSTNPLSEPASPLKSSNLSNSVPQCRKAKVIRQERKLQKLLKMGLPAEEAAASIKKKTSDPKSIEDFLAEPMPANPAHKLKLKMVPSAIEHPLFCQTFEESYRVYKKYQMTIHKDPAEKCSTKQYTRFLVNSPFQASTEWSPSNKLLGYGSFHQQYWLDDKLIAVGVIDVLPYCVSSVYFYYDPDYSFLSLGTYAALKEIALTRELNTKFKDLQYYYMGYYIHSCVKMRYKGQYVPSYLLCPETYIFQPIEKSKPKLDISKYHRLEEDPKKKDSDGVFLSPEVLILYNRTRMTYAQYQALRKKANDENDVQEYACFVGRKCYQKMLLYRD